MIIEVAVYSYCIALMTVVEILDPCGKMLLLCMRHDALCSDCEAYAVLSVTL